ncbi:glycosyltransferase family 39 protein [Candidatus Gracilibacteria bacterium]|nr:glycosyltransferase family 39 protein [Candidatus Gracilibacteria bacterium]
MALFVAVLGITISFSLLLGAFRTSPPRIIDIGGNGDAYVTRNFYDAESGADERFRWSGRDAALLLPETYTRAALLTLRLHSNAEGHPITLHDSSDGRPLATLPPSEGWRVYRVLVPRSADNEQSGTTIALTGQLSQSSAADPRELGVALDRIAVQPLPASGLLRVHSLTRVLQLCWFLLLIGGIAWLLQYTMRPNASRAARLLRSSAFSATVALFLIGWAWHDHYTLDWLLPLDPRTLSTISALLVGIAWVALTQPRFHVNTWRGKPGVPLAVSIIGLALLSRLLTLLPLAPELRGAAAYVALGLPGALLALLCFRHERDGLVRLLLALLGALGSAILLVYGLQALPGALTAGLVFLPLDLLTLMCTVLLLRQPALGPAQPPTRPHAYLPLFLLLVLAAALRLPALGSAELHDDEASVLLTAARIYYGQDDVLLLQLKGPVQVLLPTGPLVLTGLLNEWIARLPFAIAGIGIVLGSYLLARRCFSDNTIAGLFAATVLTLDGFMIAFSRIVQYQSIVMIMTIGAIWCMLRFAEGCERAARYLLASALWISLALLAHYDAIYGLPVLALLLFVGARRRGWQRAHWLRALCCSRGP